MLHCFVFLFFFLLRLHSLLYILKNVANSRFRANTAFTSAAVFPIYVCTQIVIDCRYPLATTLSFLLLFGQMRKKYKAQKKKKWKKVQNAKKCFCFSSIDCTITHTTLQPLCLLFSCLSQPWQPLRPDIWHDIMSLLRQWCWWGG